MNRILLWIFGAFVVLYGFLVAFNAAFSIIDDHTLLNTLLSGKNIPLSHHINAQIGRFYPLDGQDLNVLSAIFGARAGVFYGFNGLCVVGVIALLGLALRYLHTTPPPHNASSAIHKPN